ncbi:MAG: nuclease [Candidatus Electrothrix sp. AR4]|nr:nuclease [Candidatus Electrothrix sp. AR4]
MLASKNGMIFISHAWKYNKHYAWKYNKHYWMLIDWILEESNFSCSVPKDDTFPDKTSKDLRNDLTEQIGPAEAVVILGGMYSANRTWIDYAIDEAKRMDKPIIVVNSWNREYLPESVQKASTVPVVSWNKSSVLQAVSEVLTGR